LLTSILEEYLNGIPINFHALDILKHDIKNINYFCAFEVNYKAKALALEFKNTLA